MSQSPWTSTPFIGRHHQVQRLAELCSELETKDDGQQRLLLIEGVQGVGLSRLLDEFARQLQQEERTYTLRADYGHNLRRPPFAGLLDSLDQLLAEHFPSRRLLSLFSDPAHALLLPQLPATSERIGSDDDPATHISATDPSTLSAHLSSLLAQVAKLRPVVILLDDAQWMPEPDQQLLLGIHAALGDAAVMVVATLCTGYREHETFRSRTERMQLEQMTILPWEHHELSSLLTELCSPHIAARLGKELWHATEGFPGRTIDLLRRLTANGSLAKGEQGDWQLRGVDASLLFAATNNGLAAAEQLLPLTPPQRMLLALLHSAGGGATVAELRKWLEAVDGKGDSLDPAEAAPTPSSTTPPAVSADAILAELRQMGIIRLPQLASGKVTFLRQEIEEQMEPEIKEEELHSIIHAIVIPEAGRGGMRRWMNVPRLVCAVVRQLQPDQAELRRHVLEPLIGIKLLHEVEGESATHHLVLKALIHEEGLTERERAVALSRMASLLLFMRRHTEALECAKRMHAMATTIPECAPLLAEACTVVAGTEFTANRSFNTAPLLAEATSMLSRIADEQERQGVDLLIAKVELITIPVDRPQQGLQVGQRVYQLMTRLGVPGRYEMLGELPMRAARLRDGESLRYYCNELLNNIRQQITPPPFIALFNAVRAAHAFGDFFLARKLYSAWHGSSTPLSVRDFIARSILSALFALDDGDTERALGGMQAAEAEYHRHQDISGGVMWWDIFSVHTILNGLLARALVLSGRVAEATQFVDQAIANAETDGTATRYRDTIRLLTLYRFYLRWRQQYGAPQALLSWRESPLLGIGTPAATHHEFTAAAMADGAATAANAFRQRHTELTTITTPLVMFVAEMLLATIEAAEGKFDAAAEAINQAEEHCRRIYSYQYDLEIQTSRITLALRRAATNKMDTAARRELMEAVRGLMQGLAERGVPERIERLKEFLSNEAAADPELSEQIQRAGNSAVSAAQAVLQNSRSATSGPVNIARMLVMGPLRLMQPYSYMELSDSAFDRETARTLLTALVAAQIMGQTLTREELAGRIAPKAKTPEQQKKALYNAASAARAACCSADSILPVGSNSLGLNTNPEIPGYVWVDALELLKLLRAARQQERAGASSAAFNSYRDALALARRGDFASDCYEDWADSARDLLRGRIRDAVLALGKLALRNGHYTPAIEATTGQLSRDPYDEPMHRLLMRLHNDSGNRSAALKQFDKCAKLLQREFDAEPERETMKLRAEIVKG